MEPSNLVFILSDEHQRDIAGCYGDPIAITPNMDALAARGARFTNAYTPCPICVPARAALATGRWVHQTRSWDNAAPYHGEATTWHHRLRENGHGSCRSASCISARPKTTTASARRSSRCTCSTASGI